MLNRKVKGLSFMNKLAYEYFLEVVKRGTLSEAAEHLYVSQPAISRQISNLESELGFALFYREPHGLRLTPGGNLLFQECEKLRARYEQILSEAQSANAGKIGYVKIGIQEGHDVDDSLIDIIHNFRNEHPDIAVEVVSLSHKALLESLSLNKLDVGIAICFNEKNEFSNLGSRFLRQRQSYIILNQDHRLSRSGKLNLEALSDETLMITCPDVATDGVDFVKRTCGKLNIRPKSIRLAPSYSTLYIWLSMNEGFAISDQNAWFENRKLKYFPLPSEGDSTQVAYWAKNKISPCAKMFVDYLDSNINVFEAGLTK